MEQVGLVSRGIIVNYEELEKLEQESGS